MRVEGVEKARLGPKNGKKLDKNNWNHGPRPFQFPTDNYLFDSIQKLKVNPYGTGVEKVIVHGLFSLPDAPVHGPPSIHHNVLR